MILKLMIVGIPNQFHLKKIDIKFIYIFNNTY